MIFVESYLLMSTSFMWEVYNDRKGDPNKTQDVYIRGAIIVITAAINWWLLDQSFLGSILYGAAIHFLLFDYTIARVLGHKDWFSYLGKKSKVDNLPAWRNLSPVERLLFRITVCVISIYFYHILP